MILKELALCLDKVFNKNLALAWDKAGLQIGNLESNIKKILVTLNLVDAVAEEAINSGSNLIITHHPLIFNSLDTILSSVIGQKEILKLIENHISVYCAHTNYDSMAGGLNEVLAGKLELVDLDIIEEQSKQWYKFVIFVPPEAEEKIRNVICREGGGSWRNYSCCTFNVKGKGTFIPLEGSKPYTGKIGNINYADEVRIECIVDEKNLNRLIKEAIKAHPYEEVAYDIYRIENKFREAGAGRVGRLKENKTFADFSREIKGKLNIENFMWLSRDNIRPVNRRINKVAVVCGSANSLSGSLKNTDCDTVVVGEIGYHNALEIAESGKLIIVLGHGNSEKFAVDDIYNKLKKYFKENKIKAGILKSKRGYNLWRYEVE